MAVVGKTGCEGRTVKKGVLFPSLGQFLLGLEGVNLPPKLEHIVLRGGDVDRLGGCMVSHYQLRPLTVVSLERHDGNESIGVNRESRWRHLV